MQKEGKITIKYSPCKLPDPCLGYDPCESGEDISDKDLAVLLKEEEAKLQREKERAEAKLSKQQGVEGADGRGGAAGGKGEGADGRGGGADGKGGGADGKGGGADGKGGGADGKGGGADGKGGGADSRGGGADGKGGGADDTEGGADGGGAHGRCRHQNRRPCRKVETKNPFFTNRLSFSSDLPPPPPVPPPQFFPLMGETDSNIKVCPKKKKKKKCKEKTDVPDFPFKKRKKTKENADKGGGKVKESGVKESEEIRGDADATADGEDTDLDEPFKTADDTMECACLYENKCIEDEELCLELMRRRKRCKKRDADREWIPCRKKVSEVSISLQPRKIPALQRDLPATSPKDIPEVKRQIKMACERMCEIQCRKKKNCKKKGN